MNLKDKVRFFFDSYSAKDVDAMLELCSQGGTFRYIPEGERGTGLFQDAAKIWRLFTTAMPDFKVEVQRLISAESSTIIAETLQGGTPTEDIGQIKNKGCRTWSPHIYLFEFDEEENISHITCYWDYNTIYRQLGHTETHN